MRFRVKDGKFSSMKSVRFVVANSNGCKCLQLFEEYDKTGMRFGTRIEVGWELLHNDSVNVLRDSLRYEGTCVITNLFLAIMNVKKRIDYKIIRKVSPEHCE